MEIQYAEARSATTGPSMCRVEGVSAVMAALKLGVDPIDAMKRIHAEHGDLTEFIFRWPNGKIGSRYIFAVGAQYNETVLADPTTFQTCGVLLPGPRGSAQRRVRNGLLTVKWGPHHAHYRRLVTPPLRRSAVDRSAARMGEVVDGVIDNWPINTPVDLFPLVKEVALHVALETLFATEGESLLQESLHTAALMNEHLQMDASLAVKGCPANIPGLPYHHMLRHAEKVEATVAAWARRGSAACHPESLLSILARTPDETGAQPTEAIISAHLLTMFGASYETSQSGLAWALFLLAQQPAAAAKLLEYIEMSTNENCVLDGHVAELDLLDAVVKESLRLFPPVPLQVRRAVRDTNLAGHDIARGDYVVLSTLLTNRDPAVYVEPNKFKPERWANIKPSQYEYLVFSAGPRFCVGAWFATTFLKVAISRILRRYRLKLLPGTRVDQKVGVTMRPDKRGIRVTIHPQDGRFEASPIRGNVENVVELD